MSTDLIEMYLRHLRVARSATTVADRGRLLRRLDRDLPYGLNRAATEEIEAWLARPDWSRWTRHTYYGHIVGFYRWAVRPGRGQRPRLKWDPTEDIEVPPCGDSIPRPVTDEELADILARACEPWLTGITLAAYEGLRCSEIAAADREHITEEYTLVPCGKGGQAALLPTHPLVWRHVSPQRGGPLLRTARGKRWTGHRLSHAASAYFTDLGYPEVTLHRFRHWFGTTVQASQGDSRVTQELLRHRSPVSTAGYTLVADRRKRSALRQLPELHEHRPAVPRPVPDATEAA